MSQFFKIKPGEINKIEIGDKKYQISCEIFKNHNHQKQPLYYYHDKIKDLDLVATIIETDPGTYDSPYSNTVDSIWNVVREKHIFNFIKKENHLLIEIKKR